MRYFAQLQEVLVDWVNEYRKEQEITSRFSKNLSHFYLAGRFLSKFSESLIEQILVWETFIIYSVFEVSASPINLL
jgi:hypothetical protein